jgi:hypothetical protein
VTDHADDCAIPVIYNHPLYPRQADRAGRASGGHQAGTNAVGLCEQRRHQTERRTAKRTHGHCSVVAVCAGGRGSVQHAPIPASPLSYRGRGWILIVPSADSMGGNNQGNKQGNTRRKQRSASLGGKQRRSGCLGSRRATPPGMVQSGLRVMQRLLDLALQLGGRGFAAHGLHEGKRCAGADQFLVLGQHTTIIHPDATTCVPNPLLRSRKNRERRANVLRCNTGGHNPIRSARPASSADDETPFSDEVCDSRVKGWERARAAAAVLTAKRQ